MDSCCKWHESMLSTPTALLVATQIGFCSTNASSLVHVVTSKFFYVPNQSGSQSFLCNSQNAPQPPSFLYNNPNLQPSPLYSCPNAKSPPFHFSSHHYFTVGHLNSGTVSWLDSSLSARSLSGDTVESSRSKSSRRSNWFLVGMKVDTSVSLFESSTGVVFFCFPFLFFADFS